MLSQWFRETSAPLERLSLNALGLDLNPLLNLPAFLCLVRMVHVYWMYIHVSVNTFLTFAGDDLEELDISACCNFDFGKRGLIHYLVLLIQSSVG